LAVDAPAVQEPSGAAFGAGPSLEEDHALHAHDERDLMTAALVLIEGTAP
jgi:hypothetical protein